MSYEGYLQVICQNGHYSNIPEPYDGLSGSKCSCGADWAWSNSVDQTNYDDYGIIPDVYMESFQVKPPMWEQCNLGHSHLISPAVYRIPTPDEVSKIRHFSVRVRGKEVLRPIQKA